MMQIGELSVEKALKSVTSVSEASVPSRESGKATSEGESKC